VIVDEPHLITLARIAQIAIAFQKKKKKKKRDYPLTARTPRPYYVCSNPRARNTAAPLYTAGDSASIPHHYLIFSRSLGTYFS
jgi:hypothetical protein